MVRPWIRNRDQNQTARVVVRRVIPAQDINGRQLDAEEAQAILERAQEVGEGQPVGQLRVRRRTLLL